MSSLHDRKGCRQFVTNRVLVHDADRSGQGASPDRARRVPGFGDLVADGVHDDRGMVEVLGHHRLDVVAPPVGEPSGIVVVALGLGPHVEGLVHDEHPQPVAGVEHRLAHRMVCAAQRVEPGGFEQFDPAFLGALERGRADDAVVVVHARATQLHGLPVDSQASRHVDLEGPNAEPLIGPVDLLAVQEQQGPAPVEGRRLGAPAPRVRHQQTLTHRLALPGRHGERRLVPGDDRAGVRAAVLDQFGYDDTRRGERGVVLQRRLDHHQCGHFVDVGGTDPYAVKGDVDRMSHDELRVAIDAGARVPTRVVVRRRFDPDGVVVAVTDERVQPDREVRVPVRTLPGQHPVHEHGGVPINALELEHDAAAPMFLRDGEGLLVLPDATREVTGRR